MELLRLFLFPFALIYGAVIYIRNLFFNIGLLTSKKFDLPIIVVGNLSVGGTGKTPHIEYLIRLLQKKHKLATLSRGYGRKSKGFVLADKTSTYKDIGDEPLQYAHKFHRIKVAVDEKRARGIQNLQQLKQKFDVILLDDAFQHRYVKPGLAILLTDFHQIYKQDFLLPVGSLREYRNAAKRADIIVITKTPRMFSPITRRRLYNIIQPLPHQKLFFSYIDYGKFIPITLNLPEKIEDSYNTIILFTGIANPYPLQEHLMQYCVEIIPINFSDHHAFTEKDMSKVRQAYNNVFSKRKIILTTEKDSKRLIGSDLYDTIKDLPICYIPIEVKFHADTKGGFDKQILNYVEKDSRDS